MTSVPPQDEGTGREATMAAIREAAEGLFSSGRFEGVSVRDVAAGCATAHLYGDASHGPAAARDCRLRVVSPGQRAAERVGDWSWLSEAGVTARLAGAFPAIHNRALGCSAWLQDGVRAEGLVSRRRCKSPVGARGFGRRTSAVMPLGGGDRRVPRLRRDPALALGLPALPRRRTGTSALLSCHRHRDVSARRSSRPDRCATCDPASVRSSFVAGRCSPRDSSQLNPQAMGGRVLVQERVPEDAVKAADAGRDVHKRDFSRRLAPSSTTIWARTASAPVRASTSTMRPASKSRRGPRPAPR